MPDNEEILEPEYLDENELDEDDDEFDELDEDFDDED